ncbi:MAG TPA: class I SAM-dependent methyltransferase [Terriglobales bacterium]|nr:class I SAM-dependent methyltransferase [Terriglobales bacterium]
MVAQKLRINGVQSLYQSDLAYVHATAFETVARGAAAEIVRRLQSSSVTIHKIMDVGCGAGPLTRALVDAGFDVTGVDTSAELLRIARANVPTAHFIHASAYDAPIQDYDAVVAVGEPLTYHSEVVGADRLINGFFQHVADALPPGGIFIFDVIGLGQPSLANRTWLSGDDWAVLVETTEDQNERSLIRDIQVFRRVGDTYRRSHEVHRVRLFDISILRHDLAACGFAIETSQAYGSQQLPPRRHAFFATRLAA